MHEKTAIEARVARMMRGVGVLLAAAVHVWGGAQAQQAELSNVKRVETPYLLWMEGSDLGGGEFFANGDSLLFEHDCEVLIFGNYPLNCTRNVV